LFRVARQILLSNGVLDLLVDQLVSCLPRTLPASFANPIRLQISRSGDPWIGGLSTLAGRRRAGAGLNHFAAAVCFVFHKPRSGKRVGCRRSPRACDVQTAIRADDVCDSASYLETSLANPRWFRLVLRLRGGSIGGGGRLASN